MATRSMKRIHTVTIRHITDEGYNERQDQPVNAIGVRADAEVAIPLNEMHSAKCVEINDKRGPYHCECSSKDSLIQQITSGGLWGLDVNEPNDFLRQAEQEQLSELRGQLHAIGFSNRAITAAFRDVKRA
jgi:hypothetical protein